MPIARPIGTVFAETVTYMVTVVLVMSLPVITDKLACHVPDSLYKIWGSLFIIPLIA